MWLCIDHPSGYCLLNAQRAMARCHTIIQRCQVKAHLQLPNLLMRKCERVDFATMKIIIIIMLMFRKKCTLLQSTVPYICPRKIPFILRNQSRIYILENTSFDVWGKLFTLLTFTILVWFYKYRVLIV